MPDQPNSHTDLPEDGHDDPTATSVLHDEGMEDAGALGGAAAADDASHAIGGGTARNAAIDTGVDAGEGDGADEARLLATDEAEAHPS